MCLFWSKAGMLRGPLSNAMLKGVFFPRVVATTVDGLLRLGLGDRPANPETLRAGGCLFTFRSVCGSTSINVPFGPLMPYTRLLPLQKLSIIFSTHNK